MATFLQQSQPQTDGFQNLLGILRSNRERDAADLAAFRDGNTAISTAARKRLISNGVIDENDTLDGIKSGIAKGVAEASKVKAADAPDTGKPFGDGYVAAKMGQKGYNEQQTFASAGADAYNKRALDAGVRFGVANDPRGLKEGIAYKWDTKEGKYKQIDDLAADEMIKKSDPYKLDPEGKNGIDALRYAAQTEADKRTSAALDTPVSSVSELQAAKKANPNLMSDLGAGEAVAKDNAAAFEKEGANLSLPAVDKTRAAKQDDADAVKLAMSKVAAKAGDVDQVYRAANNESGNAQYNYARGKQYIEDMMPAGPARDAAIARYQEMFMQQQLVGKEGAYMGDIYGKGKGHGNEAGGGGGVEAVTAKDILSGAYSFELPKNHPTFAGYYAANKAAALQVLANGLGLASVNDLPEEVRTKEPAQWKGAFKQLFSAIGTQNQGVKFGSFFDKDVYDQAKQNGASEQVARREAYASAYAKGGQVQRLPKGTTADEATKAQLR